MSFLALVVSVTLVVSVLAVSAGSAVFPEPEQAGVAGGPLVDAPPPLVLVLLGLLMVAGAVARRSRKSAAGRAP